MDQMLSPSILYELAIWYLVFLFSLTLHEAAHALAARLGGDDTAYLGGQVTLNPLPHIQREPLGAVLVPIASFLFAGWMMGWASTPYDPHWARRHPRRQAAMSAAGPAGNLVIVAVSFTALSLLLNAGAFVVPHGSDWGMSHLLEPAETYGPASLMHPLAMGLSIALSLNVLLFLFNLLPLPPLDGSGVVHGLFPESAGRLIEVLRANPVMGMVGLLLAWKVFGYIFDPVFNVVLQLLYAGPI